MAQYERYARDGETLAAIGQAVGEASGDGPVALPLELARAAVDAWNREEPDGPAANESPWQIHVRRQAAALALIGEEIEKRSDLSADPVSVTLGPGLIQVALTAAADQPTPAQSTGEDAAAEPASENAATDDAAGDEPDAAASHSAGDTADAKATGPGDAAETTTTGSAAANAPASDH